MDLQDCSEVVMEVDTQTQAYTGLLQSEFGNDLISLFKLVQDEFIKSMENAEGKTIEEVESELIKLL